MNSKNLRNWLNRYERIKKLKRGYEGNVKIVFVEVIVFRIGRIKKLEVWRRASWNWGREL